MGSDGHWKWWASWEKAWLWAIAHDPLLESITLLQITWFQLSWCLMHLKRIFLCHAHLLVIYCCLLYFFSDLPISQSFWLWTVHISCFYTSCNSSYSYSWFVCCCLFGLLVYIFLVDISVFTRLSYLTIIWIMNPLNLVLKTPLVTLLIHIIGLCVAIFWRL